ncbi:hypothetical protein [Roseobacter sp.]|uniref:hypothetical protein n=1 Tax=Roseobacter sp. TaxID=1907202 RepID=UPI002966756E|nr:hypothetical protein [Roseobacter sp.]MDW3182164.1 hypothetical protein [Roseobacter sp.]
MRLAALLILILGTVGCVQFPEIDDATGQAARDADFPDLIPFDPLLASTEASQTESAGTQDQIEARVTGLQARAAGLRGSVLSSQERNRLEEEVQ